MKKLFVTLNILASSMAFSMTGFDAPIVMTEGETMNISKHKKIATHCEARSFGKAVDQDVLKTLIESGVIRE